MREMKDSGVNWIGKIPSHWTISKFASIILADNGGEVIDKSYWGDGKELLYTCQKLPMKSDYPLFPSWKRTQSGNLLLTRNATPYIFLPENGSIYSNVVQRVVLRDGYSPKYVRYALLEGSAREIVNGDTIPSYNMQVWRGIKIPNIPIEQQISISNFLDRKCADINNVLEKTKASIEEYKKLKRSVITEAVTKGVRGTRPMKESGIEWIGEIPEEWMLVKLKLITSKIGSGYTPKGGAEVYTDHGIKFIRSQNVYFDGFRLNDVVYITPEIDEEMKGTRVKDGDILFNITGGSIGRCHFVDDTFGEANVNQHVCIVRPSNIATRYLFYFLQSEKGQIQVNLSQTGGNREGLSAGAFGDFKVTLPNRDEQDDISIYLDQKCSEIDSLIESKERFIKELEDYQKSLIYEYVTGKKEVPSNA